MSSRDCMKKVMKFMLAVVLTVLCQETYAGGSNNEEGPAVRLMDSNRNTKKLEGMMLKMARPIIKNTPMVAVLDEIDMMMLCPVEKISAKDNGEFSKKLRNALKDYKLVGEIDDELSHMYIYVYGLEGHSFKEILLHITSPEENIFFFKGDFTLEGLTKVNELSIKDREKRIKNKRETGHDESYLQHTK